MTLSLSEGITRAATYAERRAQLVAALIAAEETEDRNLIRPAIHALDAFDGITTNPREQAKWEQENREERLEGLQYDHDGGDHDAERHEACPNCEDFCDDCARSHGNGNRCRC